MKVVGLFYPINIVEGESVRIPLDIDDNGTKVTLTEYLFSGAIKVNGSPVNAATFNFNEVDGEIVALPDPSTPLVTGEYIYEIRMAHNNTGIVTSLLYGTYNIAEKIA